MSQSSCTDIAETLIKARSSKAPGGLVLKSSLTAFVFAIGFSTAAFAQAATSDQRGACKTDYEKYCKGTMPGGGRVVACLNKQHDKLSAACKSAVDSRK
jgi:hypothetical protein